MNNRWLDTLSTSKRHLPKVSTLSVHRVVKVVDILDRPPLRSLSLHVSISAKTGNHPLPVKQYVFSSGIQSRNTGTDVQVNVIAAGGIYDGRGLAAMLMYGAQAVWVGTRFVAATEAAAPKKHKEL